MGSSLKGSHQTTPYFRNTKCFVSTNNFLIAQHPYGMRAFTPFLISNAHFIEGTNGEIKEKNIFVTIQYVKPILQSHSRHIIKST